MSDPVVVPGAGHNGLVTACYLAKAGKRVVVEAHASGFTDSILARIVRTLTLTAEELRWPEPHSMHLDISLDQLTFPRQSSRTVPDESPAGLRLDEARRGHPGWTGRPCERGGAPNA